MITPINSVRSGPYHRRLSAATDDQHEHLHTLVASLVPFDSRENFARFIEVQYRFQHLIEPLYRRPALQTLLPDLSIRSRRAAAAMDLIDLGRTVPLPSEEWADTFSLPHALGWLFVSEGSTLGAAVLLQRIEPLGLSATFGGRYLAASPVGRTRHWKDFIDAFDRVSLSEEEEADMIGGARAAFGYFADLVAQAGSRVGDVVTTK